MSELDNQRRQIAWQIGQNVEIQLKQYADVFHVHHMCHVQNEIQGTPEDRRVQAQEALADLDAWLEKVHITIDAGVTYYREVLNTALTGIPTGRFPEPYTRRLPDPPVVEGPPS